MKGQEKGDYLSGQKVFHFVRDIFVSRQLKLLLGLYCRVFFLVNIYRVLKKNQKSKREWKDQTNFL